MKLFDDYVLLGGGEDSSLKELIDVVGCIEYVEALLGIEFPAGDGLFLSDISMDDPRYDKLDGEVDYASPVRDRVTKKLLKVRDYRVSITDPDPEGLGPMSDYRVSFRR